MECNEFLSALGRRIQAIRKTQKLSQEKLAERANLHPVYVSNVETGHRRASICTYLSIAEALGVSLSDLVQMPGEGESWDETLVELFQSAKMLKSDKQKMFLDAACGLLKGLEG